VRNVRATTSMCRVGVKRSCALDPTAGGGRMWRGSSAQLRVRGTYAGRGPQPRDASAARVEPAESQSRIYVVSRSCSGGALGPCRPNGLSLSCTARAHVSKPTRHGGCRQGVAEPRLAICNRRDAAHSSVLTSRLGRRASAGPCRLLARVRPRVR
jgi:hypothetical protein